MSEEKLIQEIYDLTLQNNTARELDDAFKQGIEETITHLKELNLLRLHLVVYCPLCNSDNTTVESDGIWCNGCDEWTSTKE